MPVVCLMFNALVWGLSWWPFRQFEAAGLHPLWTTVILYTLSWVVVLASQRGAAREMLRSPGLWLVLLAAGTTNTAFNWGVATGDVVRVVLLFYLMPLWAVLLARLILGEPLTALAGLRILLALGGALAVLAPADGGWPLPSSLADGLGLLGGLTFAFNNVMLRREAARSPGARALAMFTGGVLVAGASALVMVGRGLVAWPSLPAPIWLIPLVGMALLFFASNLSLQYGAARLPANVTAVVMLTEVPVAALSALWLGGGSLDLKTAIGGLAIVAAAMLAAMERRRG
ncbi:DMT family transporter [Roseateles amylovorans]|uniref:DMT family transporter n=1 Tax=Roseateles amylovorans TaxID=2978473 RepID=A0ABY6B146_9BURK|nr:DMT family transporter [Roseateles amylovorans]UXH78662.1 DMT family transporter [Roseateles amylovorans]